MQGPTQVHELTRRQQFTIAFIAALVAGALVGSFGGLFGEGAKQVSAVAAFVVVLIACAVSKHVAVFAAFIGRKGALRPIRTVLQFIFDALEFTVNWAVDRVPERVNEKIPGRLALVGGIVATLVYVGVLTLLLFHYPVWSQFVHLAINWALIPIGYSLVSGYLRAQGRVKKKLADKEIEEWQVPSEKLKDIVDFTVSTVIPTMITYGLLLTVTQTIPSDYISTILSAVMTNGYGLVRDQRRASPLTAPRPAKEHAGKVAIMIYNLATIGAILVFSVAVNVVVDSTGLGSVLSHVLPFGGSVATVIQSVSAFGKGAWGRVLRTLVVLSGIFVLAPVAIAQFKFRNLGEEGKDRGLLVHHVGKLLTWNLAWQIVGYSWSFALADGYSHLFHVDAIPYVFYALHIVVYLLRSNVGRMVTTLTRGVGNRVAEDNPQGRQFWFMLGLVIILTLIGVGIQILLAFIGGDPYIPTITG